MGVGAGLHMYDVVVKKFTFAISSPDEFLFCHMFTVIKEGGARRPGLNFSYQRQETLSLGRLPVKPNIYGTVR